MISWKSLKTILGYLITLTLMVGAVMAVQSQSVDEEASAEGRLAQYYTRQKMALYPGDPNALYPNDVYPGDWPPIYPGDEKWDGQFFDSASRYTEEVYSLATDGQYIYVGGKNLPFALGPDKNLARWQNDQWTLAPGCKAINSAIHSIAIQDNDFYIGGTMYPTDIFPALNVAHWDGSQWNNMGGGVYSNSGNGIVKRVVISGSDVYAAGTFNVAGGLPVNNIARWDGSLWHDLNGGVNGPVNAMAVNGSDVYVGGLFTKAGNQDVLNIARWDGQSWHALGSGADGEVNSIAIQGNDVYVGGSFINAGNQTVNGIAHWDGGQWTPMGGGLATTVNAIAVAPEGVYAGGNFATVLGQYSAYSIAFWNGTNWKNLGSGTTGYGEGYTGGVINDILILDDKIVAGGQFWLIGNNQSTSFGIWHKLPEVTVFKLGETPIAPGSTIYLYGKFFEPFQDLQLSIDGINVSTDLHSDVDGKVYIRLFTGQENADGIYQYTLSSSGTSASGRFILQKSAPVFNTVFTGRNIFFPDHSVRLPIIQK